MKKLVKTILLLLSALLFAINAWALPMAGDQVRMTVSPGINYGMTVTAVGAGSSSIVNDFYNAFCVEKDEIFFPNGVYTVDSVGEIAYGGGSGGHDVFDSTTGDPIGDTISGVSKWLYASFFDGALGYISDSLGNQVQNAIWYAEGELGDNSDYVSLVGSRTDFTVTGWDFTVVNLVDASGNPMQSQLVGEMAPVPEPATMFLFGIGLLGLAGVSRKKLA